MSLPLLCLSLKLVPRALGYILGQGGFGTVYKGYIDENVRVGLKSLPVAVKCDRSLLANLVTMAIARAKLLMSQGAEPQRAQAQTRAFKLVKEFICAAPLPRLMFLLLYMSLLNETSAPLSWSTRMMIALGAAKGLAFLHNAERPVIYRDFKTSNILLDSDYTAKLSDFGLAKAGPQGDETHVSTRVMGTYGYAAPEYVMTGHLTARSDVYSFGVVLLELLTGKKSVDKTRPSKEQSLVD
ncbi:hypothetical protein M8C21_033464 [Ambrosia artemisiifolia]|uniref:Protein kinase domain-containing protein n=1 Tax=Ambrosia artemisiifolia TaxID=4212 RepID=A0AAD5GMZ4_AMBAR|nr:hypothetical protein M8C21_033464 [Ambrosia artemisiifolia]